MTHRPDFAKDNTYACTGATHWWFRNADGTEQCVHCRSPRTDHEPPRALPESKYGAIHECTCAVPGKPMLMTYPVGGGSGMRATALACADCGRWLP